MDYEVEGRSTGRGAFTDATILFPGAGFTEEPDCEEISRAGTHWQKIWYSLPEGTVVLYIDITNSGKEYREIKTLHRNEWKTRARWERGEWQQDELENAADLWRNFHP